MVVLTAKVDFKKMMLILGAAAVVLLALILGLEIAVVMAGGTSASFTPRLKISPLGWGFPLYCCLLLIPTILHLKEAVVWQFFRWKI